MNVRILFLCCGVTVNSIESITGSVTIASTLLHKFCHIRVAFTAFLHLLKEGNVCTEKSTQFAMPVHAAGGFKVFLHCIFSLLTL